MSTVFITGISSGIGRGTAKVFLENGWKVAGTELEPELDEEFLSNENVKLYKLNVIDVENDLLVVQQAIKDFGTIDAVVNNAGMGIKGPIELASYEQILKIVKVNLMGYVMICKSFIPYFRQQGSGTFVNVGAAGGRIVHPGLGLYNMTKAAVASFTEELLMEMIPFGVDVKLVEPAGVKSDLGTVGTDVLPEDLEKYKFFYEYTMQQTFDIVTGHVPGTDEHYGPIEPEDMGKIIYEAATDKTGKFYFTSGPHATRLFEEKAKMTDQEYIDFYKDFFTNKK